MSSSKKSRQNIQQEEFSGEQEAEQVENEQQEEQVEQLEAEDNMIEVENQQQQGEKHEEYMEKLGNRGICYMSRIPPYMKPSYIKKLLQSYFVERIYLLPESQWTRKNRIKRGGNKKICFREGWIEFSDKRMAKLAALTLNGQKMVAKKGNFYSQDVWNLKYLPKFKWHHLTERLAHEERLKRERLKVELEAEKKVEDFYSQKLAKSKMINGIVNRKMQKGKSIKAAKQQRQFSQAKMAPQIADQ